MLIREKKKFYVLKRVSRISMTITYFDYFNAFWGNDDSSSLSKHQVRNEDTKQLMVDYWLRAESCRVPGSPFTNSEQARSIYEITT